MADYKEGIALRVPTDDVLNPNIRASRMFDVYEYSENMTRLNKCSGVAETQIDFPASKSVIGTLLRPTEDGFVPMDAGSFPSAALQWYVYDPATDELVFLAQSHYGWVRTVVDWSNAEGLLLYNDDGAITDVPVGRYPIGIAIDGGMVTLDTVQENRVQPGGVPSQIITKDGDFRSLACILWDGDADYGIESMTFTDDTYVFTFDREYVEIPTIVTGNNDLSGVVAAVMLDEVTTTGVKVTLRNNSNQKVRADDGFSLIGFAKRI